MAWTRSTCRASSASRAARSPALAAAASASSLMAPGLTSPVTSSPSGVVDGDLGDLDLVAAVDLGQRGEPHQHVAAAHAAQGERAVPGTGAGRAPTRKVGSGPVGDVDLGRVAGGGHDLDVADPGRPAEVEVDAHAGLELGEVVVVALRLPDGAGIPVGHVGHGRLVFDLVVAVGIEAVGGEG